VIHRHRFNLRTASGPYQKNLVKVLILHINQTTRGLIMTQPIDTINDQVLVAMDVAKIKNDLLIELYSVTRRN